MRLMYPVPAVVVWRCCRALVVGRLGYTYVEGKCRANCIVAGGALGAAGRGVVCGSGIDD